MRKWVLTVVAAVLAGLLAGSAAHFATRPGVAVPTGSQSTTASPSPVSTKKKASTTASPNSPSGSASATPDASTSAAPFTDRSLLTTDELEQYGWTATRTEFYDDFPGERLTRCAAMTKDREPAGAVAAFGAVFQGEQSAAAEVAARFADEAAAKAASEDLHEAAVTCAETGERHSVPGVENGSWWNVAAGERTGFVAVARDGDRVMVFSMSSAIDDPAQSVQVDDLVRQATARLN